MEKEKPEKPRTMSLDAAADHSIDTDLTYELAKFMASAERSLPHKHRDDDFEQILNWFVASLKTWWKQVKREHDKKT